MVLVTVGKVIDSFLYPKWAPIKTNGMETPHHMIIKIRMFKNGTDPDERWKANAVFKKRNSAKHVARKNVAVTKVQTSQDLPKNNL